MTPYHIAIVGCGFTGTSAFYQLVDKYPVTEITIFESSGDFGPGYPYRSDDCADYLLNNTNDTLCLVPGNRRAFLAWLESKPEYRGDADPKGHLPRRVFGAFLSEAFTATQLSAAIKGIKVNLIAQEATSMLERPNGRVRIGWAGGETTAHAALLTTGRCPDVDPCPKPPEGSQTIYISNHIRTDAFDRIALDAKVHVLGASLSAYDVINRLFSPETGCRFVEGTDGRLDFEPGPNDRHVFLCSRSGRLKATQSRAPMDIARRHFTLDAFDGHRSLSLDDLQAALLQDAFHHGATLSPDLLAPYKNCDSAESVTDRAGTLLEQAIDAASGTSSSNFLVDLLSDAQIDLWDGWAAGLLEPEAEARYRSNVESGLLSYLAPCPISTALKLLALHSAGRLTVRKGIGSVTLDAADKVYRITHDFGTDTAKVLINTTGSLDRDPESASQPALIQSLVADGSLHRHEGGLGAAVDMAHYRASGARNVYLANMMLWGPGFFTSSAFMMALVVERLLDALFAEPTAQSTYYPETA